MLHTDPENVSGMVLRIVRGKERSFRISLPLPLNVTVTPTGCCRTERPGGTVTMSRRAKRCDSGCCAATATYSITAKKIAASLIAQFRANSCPTLTGIDELPDEELVHGSIPLRCADHFLDDDPVPVDHEALGHAGGLIDVLDAPALVLDDVEAEPQLPHELHDPARVPVVDADRDHREVRSGELPVESLERRHLDPARRAPGGPHVEQDDPAAVGGERRRPSGAQVDGAERGRPRPDGDQVELRPDLRRQHHAEDQRRRAPDPDRPLPHLHHTVTRQRRRSSRTATTSAASASGVPGLSARPASIPRPRTAASWRCTCSVASGWSVNTEAPAAANASM